jgi:hypothetical protein
MKIKFPNLARFSSSLDAIVSGRERIAGLVVEERRLRFAEFRPIAKKGKRGRVLIEEGAVNLPKGTIRGGALAKPDLLTDALKKLTSDGKPHWLCAESVVLSVPFSHLVTHTATIPATVREEEIEGMLKLELERTLPFPLDEAYLDWQEIKHGDAKGGGRLFLVAAIRRSDVEGYLGALSAAGIRAVAVEPMVFSIVRGLEDRSGVTYAIVIFQDAIFMVASDASQNARLFRQRNIPHASEMPLNDSERRDRAEAIASEVSTFIRFFRAEVGGIEQEIIVDGILDETSRKALSDVAASSGLAIRFEDAAHGLSKAAARGAALRAIIPRGEDRLISLMAVGTEAAYRIARRIFFTRLTFRILILGTALSVILLLGTLGFLSIIEQRTKTTVLRSVSLPPETQEVVPHIDAINAAIGETTKLLPTLEIPPTFFSDVLAAAAPGVRIDRVTTHIEGGAVRVELAVASEKPEALESEREIISKRFAAEPLPPIPIEVRLSETRPILYAFTFTLRMGETP